MERIKVRREVLERFEDGEVGIGGLEGMAKGLIGVLRDGWVGDGDEGRRWGKVLEGWCNDGKILGGEL